jgi:hypothetical protein
MPRRGKKAERAKSFTVEQRADKAVAILRELAFPKPNLDSNDMFEQMGSCMECGAHPHARRLALQTLFELGEISKQQLEENSY